jgi:peroxiredoxin
MAPNICLIVSVMLAGQSPERSQWQIAPHLSAGQELVYRGTFSEEIFGRGVEFKRAYRLDNRVFVLESSSEGINAAIYTVLRLRTSPSGRGEPEPCSVRLELAKVDPHGHLTAEPGVILTVPMEGPATAECGAFVEFPRGSVKLKQAWEVLDNHRPAQAWKLLGVETMGGTRCFKIEAVQKSEDWDHPRADRTAWRRRDLVWVAQDLGIAFRVERTIERRDPAQVEATQRSIAQFELQSNLRYPGRLFEDRRHEILQAHKFYESVAPMLPNPSHFGPQVFQVVEERIEQHIANQAPTPYRDAILQVKRRVEAAQRGEVPPAAAQDEESLEPSICSIGCKAPDFVVPDLTTRESVHLRRWLGKPLLMVFYNPTSASSADLLRFAQGVQDSQSKTVHVVAFAFSEDGALIRKQKDELHLTIPILAGKGLRQAYAVDATPKLVLIDSAAIVRGSYIGWGPETPLAVKDELRLWLPRKTRP